MLINISLFSECYFRINANDEAIEILNTESTKTEPIGGHGVNMSLTHNDHARSSERSKLMPSSHISPQASRSGFLTVTGTIKNGKNKGNVSDCSVQCYSRVWCLWYGSL